MKILAIDASTKSTGYAVGEDGVLKSHGCITASSRQPIKRIIKMRDQLSKIIKTNDIKKIVIQEVRPDHTSHTYKLLTWLQAIIAVTAFQIDSSIDVEYIGASTWRAALKIKQGPGVKRGSLKDQDIQYVQDKYKIKVNDDQADAICIFDAYCEKFDNQINWE